MASPSYDPTGVGAGIGTIDPTGARTGIGAMLPWGVECPGPTRSVLRWARTGWSVAGFRSAGGGSFAAALDAREALGHRGSWAGESEGPEALRVAGRRPRSLGRRPPSRGSGRSPDQTQAAVEARSAALAAPSPIARSACL